jgi:Xaa-Pro aminopeptidase
LTVTPWHAIGHDAEWDARIAKALNEVRAQTRAGKRAPRAIHDLRFELDSMRLIKDSAEADIQQRSADIASAGHARAMRACRPGMAEYELEAELTYEFRKRGADAHAYTPIVAGGANACVLHYVSNDKILNDHTLVLIDAGCEVEGYAADITRTFPVNGRFNGAQKDVYEIVLAAQAAAIAVTAPGRHFMEGHDAAVRVLTQGMIDLKLLSGDLDNLIDKGDFRRSTCTAPATGLAWTCTTPANTRLATRGRSSPRHDPDRRTRPLHPPRRRHSASPGRHRHPHRGRCPGHRNRLRRLHHGPQDGGRHRGSHAP